MSVAHHIGLITEDNLQADMLRHYLMDQLAQDIVLVRQTEELSVLCPVTPQLLLIDLDYLKGLHGARWREAIMAQSAGARVVLLNAPHDVGHEMLVDWPNLSGLFFRRDPLQQLVSGIRRVLQGEMWLPRQLMSELLCYYRDSQPQGRRQVVGLTLREQEILRYLMTGASNGEIANSLFVSEHTIKSHLYNVFKKIHVKNRLQAVQWAKEHLDARGWH